MSPDGSTKSPLPEERLLKLIRAKTSRPEAEAAAAPRPGAAVGASAIPMSAGAVAARMRQLAWPRLAVTGLGAVLAIEAVVLVIQVVRPLPPIFIPAVTANPSPSQAPPPPAAQMPSLAESASRPLFATSAASDAGSVSAPRAAPSGSAKQLASRLTLLGIIPGNPAQAIIEDAETKKTYFVSTGQAVVEGAVLDQVLENHVVLDLQGEKIELTL